MNLRDVDDSLMYLTKAFNGLYKPHVYRLARLSLEEKQRGEMPKGLEWFRNVEVGTENYDYIYVLYTEDKEFIHFEPVQLDDQQDFYCYRYPAFITDVSDYEKYMRP